MRDTFSLVSYGSQAAEPCGWRTMCWWFIWWTYGIVLDCYRDNTRVMRGTLKAYFVSPFTVGGVAKVPQGHLVALYSAFGATFEFEASPI